MDRWVGFPAVVNEKAARVVAAGVVLLTATILATGWWWLTVLLAGGFALRVAAGPRWSPLGRLAAEVVAPRLGEPRLVPGPPKRFAQAVGLGVSAAAAVAVLGLGGAGAEGVATGLLGKLLAFAALESVWGFCAGCWAFGLLMRAGWVPQETCAACSDITARRSSVVAPG
ncbi:MAG TPA: DUF4395 domain-containing protein [Dermatophilaceae bacterium]|nr:DUF4395 domain-containing protein [Dermatophilaceae bacterium]